MPKSEVDVIDDPELVLDEFDAEFDAPVSEITEDLATSTDISEGEVEEARAAIAASKDSADRLMSASRELESLVFGVIQDEGNSLAGTEVDIADAKEFLNRHNLKKARKSVKKAEKSLASLEEDVLYLRRNIAMLHRLLNEKRINEEEVETILLRLRSATGAAEIGDVAIAAGEVEHLVDDLIGGNTSTLNPFLFRHFWLGLDTRWPAGGDEGVLIVRIINDGPVAMPNMRLAPPVPEGWTCVPSSVDLPIIAPGGNLPLRFEVKANRRYGADEIPLSRKLAIATSYEMRTGEITATIRAQNRSMEPLQDIVLSPWIPPGFTTDSVPFINRLAPDEVALIRMPLRINIGSGGNA
tara:strand:- start:853 stop:1914 length:1062 start_codon:yes stop_codon:yes gene_type:complete